MQSIIIPMNEENVISFLISKVSFFPTATVVVAHSPTPSAVKTTASFQKVMDKMHLPHGLNDVLKIIFDFHHLKFSSWFFKQSISIFF